MKAVVIVAHPDDETIWSGGLIIRHPEWDWTVFSLCRANDPGRSQKFKAVCEQLGVIGIISDLNDEDPFPPIPPKGEIARRIMESVGKSSWDLCVTHGSNGEYGHQRHREVHADVISLVGDGLLGCGGLWSFAYECSDSTGVCNPAPSADILLELTDIELAEKRRIVHEQYGYCEGSFELKACISPEAFKREMRMHKE